MSASRNNIMLLWQTSITLLTTSRERTCGCLCRIRPKRDTMKCSRRTFLRVASGAAAFRAISCSAWAQSYPARPVRLLVGFAPGGPNDIVARLVGEKLSEVWGRPVVIDNVTGAGGNLATERAAKASPQRPYAAYGGGGTNSCQS